MENENYTYNHHTVKREFEKLYSDIICLDINNINDKNKQWELYQLESNKLINKYSGDHYNKLNKFDEIFRIGDKIDIYYMMSTKQAVIRKINVELDVLTWHTEYTLKVEYPDKRIGELDHRMCIHLSEVE